MRSCFSGETALSPLSQGKDVYELEVRVNTLHTYTHLLFFHLNLISVSLPLVGFATNKGVRDPVSETGNSLFER